jgi:hypothetical protein
LTFQVRAWRSAYTGQKLLLNRAVVEVAECFGNALGWKERRHNIEPVLEVFAQLGSKFPAIEIFLDEH